MRDAVQNKYFYSSYSKQIVLVNCYRFMCTNIRRKIFTDRIHPYYDRCRLSLSHLCPESAAGCTRTQISFFRKYARSSRRYALCMPHRSPLIAIRTGVTTGFTSARKISIFLMHRRARPSQSARAPRLQETKVFVTRSWLYSLLFLLTTKSQDSA